MNQTTTVTVLGAGYVGLTTATLLANAGVKTYVVEPNPKRLEVIKTGRSFFFEEGLDTLVAKGIEMGTLIPTDSYEDSLPSSDIVFSCVGTPDNPDGSSNLSYVFSSAEDSIRLAKEGLIYIQKSTVPVGTGEKIEAMIASAGKKITYLSNPEFLRESTALFDTLYFDRVVVGGSNNQAMDEVISLYKEIETRRDEIAKLAGIKQGMLDGQYIKTSRNSAELIKVTANAFLALKITFANSIAIFADKVGADIKEVMSAVGADPRIGKAFLNAGRGFGGGCFPKDVSGLISSADEHGVDLTIMKAARDLNNSMPQYVVDKLKAHVGDIAGKKIAVLGLAFKSGTSDVRKSPGIKIANLLAKEATVKAYDPQAMEEAKEDLVAEVQLVANTEAALSDADIVVVATEWKDFADLSPEDYVAGNQSRVVVDAVNILDKKLFTDAGVTHIGIGR